MNLLEKSEFPMSRDQIAKELDDEPIKISKRIRILLKHKEIKCVELDRYQSAKLLKWDIPIRRTRFYYIAVSIDLIKKWQNPTTK